MAKYITKESIEASGYENAITVPYKGKALRKIFPKGAIFEGVENNSFGQNIILTDENQATDTIDKDTKLKYNGKVQFAIDPSKVQKILTTDFVTKAVTPSKPISDLEYYTSSAFLKRASVSIVPVALIGAYCYHKKFSLTKSALLVSIPIVAITILQNIGFSGGKNAYWGIFTPPSIRENKNAELRLIEKTTGLPQKMV